VRDFILRRDWSVLDRATGQLLGEVTRVPSSDDTRNAMGFWIAYVPWDNEGSGEDFRTVEDAVDWMRDNWRHYRG
jgi:hypothetical protein